MGSGGKTGGAGRNYDYFGTVAVAICNGPVDVLHSVLFEGKEIYAGPLTRGAENFVDLTGSIDPKYFTDSGYLKIYWGTSAQTVDAALAGHPDHKNIAHLVGKNILFGTGKSTAPNIEVVVGRKPVCDTTLCAAIHNVFDDGQINPIAALAELFTSPFGQGLPLTRFDAASWAAAAAWCHTNKTMRFCSPLITDVADLRVAAKQLLEIAGAVLAWTATGTLAVKLLQLGTDTGGLTTFDYTVITERPRLQSGGWSDVPTGVIVTYFDRDKKFKESDVKLDNIAVRQVRGETQRTEIAMPHITRRAQAEGIAAEFLRLNQHPPLTAEISVRREHALNHRSGDKVKVDVDPEPGGTGLAQLAIIEERTDSGAGEIKLRLRADPVSDATPYTPTFNPTPQTEAGCLPITNALVIPLPPTANPEGSVAILATRPQADCIGFRVGYNEGSGSGGVSEIGIQNGFACRATLDAAVLTSGELVVNLKYKIEANTGGADFTGVGAANNNVGTQFIATGISPTWGTGGKLTTVSEQVFANNGSLVTGTLRTGIRYLIESNFDTDFTPIGGPDGSLYHIGRTFFCTAASGITWGTGVTLLRTCTVQESDEVLRLSLPDTIDNYLAGLTAETETNAENDHLVLVLAHTGSDTFIQNLPALELPDYDASVEVFSVVSRAAVDSDTHDYIVKRGRKGFKARQWSQASSLSKVWIIPGKDFEAWSHYRMKQKIVEGDFAVFDFDFMSLTARTGYAEDDSSPVPEFPFVFPKDAFVKPRIEWATPASTPHQLASGTLSPAATITDSQGDIVRVELFSVREDTQVQTKHFDLSIPARASITLADCFTLTGAGSSLSFAQGTTDRYYTLTIRATDAAGHIVESSVTLLRTGSSTTKGFTAIISPLGGEFVSQVTVTMTRNGATATQLHFGWRNIGAPAPTQYRSVTTTPYTLTIRDTGRLWVRVSDGTTHSQWQFADFKKVLSPSR